MKSIYYTPDLLLSRLCLEDCTFIKRLVNTPGWLRFIGDRNIGNKKDAIAFINSVISNPVANIWVVKLKQSNLSIGIVSLIKREYLQYFDIGFAFLPEFTRKGYGYQAANCILSDVTNLFKEKYILATTKAENSASIQLLKKLGLRYDRHILVENEDLSIYSILVDKININRIIKDFYSLFTTINNRQLVIEKIYSLCLSGTQIFKKSPDQIQSYSLESFIKPRKQILTDGTLIDFEEYEIDEVTEISENIAHRLSKYQKKGYLNGKLFEGFGNKSFQFVKIKEDWKIASVVWEDIVS